MQKRKGHKVSPAQGKGMTADLSKHLLVEGGPSRIIREFLAGKQLMGRSSTAEKADEAAKKAIAHLKAKGLVNVEAVDLDRREIEELLNESIKEILEKVNSKEPRGYVESGESREFATEMRKTKDYMLVVTDPEERLKKSPPIKNAVEGVLKGIRFFGSGVYAVHLLAKGEFVGIRINDGSHKGYIAIFCPEDSRDWIMYFNHYEHGGGAFPTNRITYLQSILIEKGMDVDFKQTFMERKDAGFVRGLCCGVRDHEKRLSGLMRLSRSVKNLDFILKSQRDVKLAIHSFGDGATNVQNFLTVLGDYIKRGDMERHKAVLNEDERELLIRYRTEAKDAEKKVNAHRRYVTGILRISSEAKKLNFEILEDLAELQKVLLRCQSREMTLKREVNSLFRNIAEKTLAMAKIMDGFVSERKYREKAKEIIDHYKKTIDGCSSWVLDNTDADRIMDMTADKGGVLSLENVRTIEELVRFMHAEIVKVPVSSIYHEVAYKEKGLAFLEYVDLELPSFICLNIDEEQTLGQLKTYKILRDMAKDLPWELTEMEGGGKAIAVLGQRYAEITLPMGKHFAEIRCEIDDKNTEYAINLWYVDTDYHYAPKREEYVRKVLLDLGFTIEKSRSRTVMAASRTEDSETWTRRYSELLRLLFSARNLDIFSTRTEPIEMFRDGFIFLSRCDSAYDAIKYSADAEKAKGYQEVINGAHYTGKDKRAFTNLFMEQFGYKPSEIIPLIKDFDLKELDSVFVFLLDLEKRAEEEGNKKQVGQIQRLCKKLDKLMEDKES